MNKHRQAVIVDGLRTPFGRAHPTKGWFRQVRGDELAASCLRELIARNELDVQLVDDVILGIALPTGELSLNAARQISLLAGLPVTCPAATVNRLCGSSLQALNQAAHAIETGAANVIFVGGVERMSAQPAFDPTIFHPQLAKFTSYDSLNMGLTAEHLARTHGISRTDQDAYAARSHELTAAARPAAGLKPETLPTWGHDESGKHILVASDQCLRPDTTPAALAKLLPAFNTDGGTITAGNSSPRNDGAAALLVMARETALALGHEPLATIRGSATVGITPCEMGLGPVPAIQRLLTRQACDFRSVDHLELNEAFAAQVLACVQVGSLPMEKLNRRGGAIAIGHPLGASGARLVLSLLHSLHSTDSHRGIAALCVGLGQGMATLIERD
jgi:acetyl-CoA acyltransferase